MRLPFPLFQSHLDLAHSYWDKLVAPDDLVIDATCGNGHDTLKLSQLAYKGKVYAFDVQQKAVCNTKKFLGDISNVLLEARCHSTFPDQIPHGTIKLIVYNLGYLPGGNKQFTTVAETTLASVRAATQLIMPGGAISITCYPGHQQGAIELEMILKYAESLPPQIWNCCFHQWMNRAASPGLLLMQRAKELKS